MKTLKNIRPNSLKEVAEQSESLEDFGYGLRDWDHIIQRSGIHSGKELSRRIQDKPPRLQNKFKGGDTADAYLAAYAEWLANGAGIERPDWVNEPSRVSKEPWFGGPDHAYLITHTPASFRQRNLFTIPEPIFTPRPGRPRVPEEQKREKARLRQKAYRDRRREELKRLREKFNSAQIGSEDSSD